MSDSIQLALITCGTVLLIVWMVRSALFCCAKSGQKEFTFLLRGLGFSVVLSRGAGQEKVLEQYLGGKKTEPKPHDLPERRIAEMPSGSTDPE